MTNEINLCQAACNEFKTQGFKKDIDPTSLKESYNIVKLPDGQWLKSTKPSLHEAAITTALPLDLMPALKQIMLEVDELDSDIRKNGGRIFISEYLVYKIKKGTQTPLIVFENNERQDGKYRKLCDELISLGFARDRYRTEETYMLAKNAGNEWSITTSHKNHSGSKNILNLHQMPQLKLIASKIARQDNKFQTNGGRIFITPTRIYRLNNKVEVVFKL